MAQSKLASLEKQKIHVLCLNQTRSFMKRCFWFFPLFVATMIINAQQIWHQQNGAILTAPKDATKASFQDNSIIGSWTLQLQAFDNNSNGKLDEEERKKGNTGKHFYQFNADGTCLIHTMKLKGWYELKDEAGKKRLYTYVDDEGTSTPENKWYVISVGKTEMILLSQDKYAFWIYKRV